MKKLSPDGVSHLNTCLMVVSCLAAFAWPFELFLFSYAVLGPLHYLTEIQWLHDKDYFARERGDRRAWLTLVALAMLVVVYGVASPALASAPASPTVEITLFYLVFAAALLVGAKTSRRVKVSLVAAAALGLLALSGRGYYAVAALFLITIIHVFVFTAAFVLHGALRSRSWPALVSLAAFVLCAASFFVFVPEGHAAGAYVRASYASFNALNAEMIKLLGLGAGTSAREVYESQAGLMVMRLIAFAYTYHYLNWFSKTSVIKWHESARRRAALIVALWAGSLALYAYDYEVGMTVLYSLSILHVMLEFPLNGQTFAGIAHELRALVARPATATVPAGRKAEAQAVVRRAKAAKMPAAAVAARRERAA